MKIGGNFVVSGDWGTKLYQHRACQPDTVRIPMFWNGQGPHFAPWQLDQIRDNGRGGTLREMIIQSSENSDENRVWWEYEQMLSYFRANPNLLFIFEIGNEPDQYPGDGGYHARRLMNCVWKIRDERGMGGAGNVLLAVNMPAGVQQDGQWTDPNWLHQFFAPQSGYNGDILNGQYSPRVITVHGYGHATLCPNDTADPWYILRWVRDRTGKNVKITEANVGLINGQREYDPAWPDNPERAYRGWKIVEAANKINSWHGGAEGIDSFCVYGFGLLDNCNLGQNGQPYEAIGWGTCGGRPYELFGGECEAIGRRYQASHCG